MFSFFLLLNRYFLFNIKPNIKQENIDISIFSRFSFGGAYRSRTDHQSFADSCLTAWLRRHIKFLFLIKIFGAGNGNRTRNLTLARLCFTTKLYLHISTSNLRFAKVVFYASVCILLYLMH